MAKNSIEAYGAAGKSNLLFFDPERLTLVTDKSSPLYDPRVHLPVDEDLARNIDYHGVLQALSVLKNPETGAVEVAVGRQRVKAARLANVWRRARGVEPINVPAIVHKGARRDALDVIVSENELRQADSPLGRAGKMRRLLAIGRDEEQIAVIFGCTPSTVRSTLALLNCTSAVQTAVESGQIGVTQAKKLAKLEPAEQREKVAALVAAGEGAKGHVKARQQRAVLVDAKPKMKTRKAIAAALETASGARAEALSWVLGLEAEKEALPGLNAAKAAFAELDTAA